MSCDTEDSFEHLSGFDRTDYGATAWCCGWNELTGANSPQTKSIVVNTLAFAGAASSDWFGSGFQATTLLVQH